MVVRDRSVTFSSDGAELRVVSQAEGRPTHVAEVVAVAKGGLTTALTQFVQERWHDQFGLIEVG